MVEPVLLGFVGVIVTGVLTAFGVILGNQSHRIHVIEARMARAKSYNARLWAWCRALLDLYYRYRKDDAPDPPELPEDDSDTP